MEIIELRVRELKAGDYLIGSRQRVATAPGRNPARRRVVLELERANGSRRWASWGPSTTVRVVRGARTIEEAERAALRFKTGRELTERTIR